MLCGVAALGRQQHTCAFWLTAAEHPAASCAGCWCRWLQGLCAAHAQAVQVLLPRMHGTGLSQVQHLHVACCLLDVVAWAPAALATSRELQLGLTYALEALAPQVCERRWHMHCSERLIC